jgi:hypothetical protein
VNLTLTIDAVTAGFNVTTTSLPMGIVGRYYNAPLNATGKASSGSMFFYTFTATPLPPGLSMTGDPCSTPSG